MKRRFSLSESEWVFSALVLIWASNVIPHWGHSFVFLFSFLIYVLLFKLKSYRAIFLFSLSSSLFFLWNFYSTHLVGKLGLNFYLSEFTNYLRPKLSKLIENNYSTLNSDRQLGERCAQFVSFLLFNQKEGLNRESSSFLKELFNLSISHLLVVSGLHLGILKAGISKLLRIVPFKVVRKLFILLSLFSYVWATAFSLPSSRVLFEELVSLGDSEEKLKERYIFEERKSTPSLLKWAKASCFSASFFPNSVNSSSFLLSYFFSFFFRLLDRWGDKVQWTRLQKTICKIALASLLSTFIFSYKTKKLLVFSALNQLFLSPIILPIFIFYLLTWPFSFLSWVGLKLYLYFRYLISFLSLNKSYIPRFGGSYLELLYFSFALSLVTLFFSFWVVRFSKSENLMAVTR